MANWRIQLARVLAVIADVVQLGFMPLFGEGAVSPFDDVLDVVMGIAMVALLGWNWAFAPALIAELVPGVDLAPTWTIAVWLVTRKLPRASEQTVEALPAAETPKGD